MYRLRAGTPGLTPFRGGATGAVSASSNVGSAEALPASSTAAFCWPRWRPPRQVRTAWHANNRPWGVSSRWCCRGRVREPTEVTFEACDNALVAGGLGRPPASTEPGAVHRLGDC
jgi:hypothetical protein